MLVSIIVPTYNRLGYLRETIESVVAQTYRDIELLLVDDESADDVEGLARSFNDERIRFIRITHTGRPGINVNLGLAQARGDAIMGLGSDDNLLPDCVEKLVAAMRADPECVMAQADIWLIDGEGKRMKRATETLPDRDAFVNRGGDFLRVMLKGNAIPGTTCLMRRSVIDRFGGWVEEQCYQGGEDYEMMVRFAGAGRVVYIDEPLGEFRLHSSEQMSTCGKAHFTTLSLVKKWQKEYTDPESRRILRAHEADLYKRINAFHLRLGDEKTALKIWWAYCVKDRKPWMLPAVIFRIIRWRKLRRLMRTKGLRF